MLVLRACAFGLGFYPLLTGLTTSVPPLPIYAGFAGIFLRRDRPGAVRHPAQHLPAAPHGILYRALPVHHLCRDLPRADPGHVSGRQLGYAPALFVGSGLRFAGAALFVLLGVGAAAGAARAAG